MSFAELALLANFCILVPFGVWYLKWRQRLLEVRNPEIGQIWICMRNMKKYRVTSVTTSDYGTIDVSMSMEGPRPGFYGMGDHYAYGIEHWRRMIVETDMQFLGMDVSYYNQDKDV